MNEVQSLILACVRDGKTISEAAREADTPIGTVRRWLTTGRNEPDGPYGAFARSVDACRLTVPEQTTGDRLREIEALAGMIGDGAAEMALLGLARALARKIDWCETTPTGAAAMALANLSKQYREVLAQVTPPSESDMEWLGSILRGDTEHQEYFRENLEHIATAGLSAEDAAAHARLVLETAEGNGRRAQGAVFAAPGTFDGLQPETGDQEAKW